MKQTQHDITDSPDFEETHAQRFCEVYPTKTGSRFTGQKPGEWIHVGPNSVQEVRQ